jgi:hypothetical protein
MNVTNLEDGVPQRLVESLRRNRFIEKCGRSVERNALADDNMELVTEMRRRALETRRMRFQTLHEIRAHRQMQAPARDQAVPRPRVRARRPRAGARRAAGPRSGADPGGEDDPDDGPRLEELARRFPSFGDRIWAEVREKSDEQLERYFRGERS